MKKITLFGEDIKKDNGSGYALSQAFPKRKFHDKTLYEVSHNGIQLDNSTVVNIIRSKTGFNV